MSSHKVQSLVVDAKMILLWLIYVEEEEEDVQIKKLNQRTAGDNHLGKYVPMLKAR